MAPCSRHRYLFFRRGMVRRGPATPPPPTPPPPRPDTLAEDPLQVPRSPAARFPSRASRRGDETKKSMCATRRRSSVGDMAPKEPPLSAHGDLVVFVGLALFSVLFIRTTFVTRDAHSPDRPHAATQWLPRALPASGRPRGASRRATGSARRASTHTSTSPSQGMTSQGRPP